MTYKTHISMAMGITTLPFSFPLLIGKENGENLMNKIFGYLFDSSEVFFQYHNINIDNNLIKNIILLILFYIMIIIGSLFPDIDHKNAKLNKWIKNKLFSKRMIYFYSIYTIMITLPYFLKKLPKEISIYIEKYVLIFNNFQYINIIHTFVFFVLFLSISKIIGQNFKHRKETHSYIYQTLFFVTGIILIPQIFENLSWVKLFLYPLFIGSVIHVFSDMYTKSGVAILNPIIEYRFRLLPKSMCVLTTSKAETIFYFTPFMLLTIFNYFQFLNNIN